MARSIYQYPVPILSGMMGKMTSTFSWPLLLDIAVGQAGGRKGTYKVEGPQVLQQVLQHLSRCPKRQRKAAPSEKMVQLLK